MVGDGVIDHHATISGWLEGIRYTVAFFELEIFSEFDWWKRVPEEVLQRRPSSVARPFRKGVGRCMTMRVVW
jgi:hypothetical protein